jgi:hypothetical protein
LSITFISFLFCYSSATSLHYFFFVSSFLYYSYSTLLLPLLYRFVVLFKHSIILRFLFINEYSHPSPILFFLLTFRSLFIFPPSDAPAPLNNFIFCQGQIYYSSSFHPFIIYQLIPSKKLIEKLAASYLKHSNSSNSPPHPTLNIILHSIHHPTLQLIQHTTSSYTSPYPTLYFKQHSNSPNNLPTLQLI